jgi:hypothetical protein
VRIIALGKSETAYKDRSIILMVVPVLCNAKVNVGVLVGFISCESEYCGVHEYEW